MKIVNKYYIKNVIVKSGLYQIHTDPYIRATIMMRNKKTISGNRFQIKKNEIINIIFDQKPEHISMTKIKPLKIDKKKMTIFYLVSANIFQKTNGYTVRTHELLSYLCQRYNIICISKPSKTYKERYLDGVTYINLVGAYYESILDICQDVKPDIIQACSDHINPSVGLKIAKKFNIRCIYEIRGLWHFSKLSFQPEWENTEEYENYIVQEELIYQQVDLIAVQTEYIKNELKKYHDKIIILPNAIDPIKWAPKERDQELIEKYQLNNITIGYIGSLVNYEGIDLLIRAANLLQGDFKILIVGQGITRSCQITYQKLIDLTKELKLEDKIIFTGQVSNHVIKKYYSIIDIICLPRKGDRVCELVAPLKPYEAMSLGITVIGSDVAPLRDLVSITHKKDDYIDLAEKLQELINCSDLLSIIGADERRKIIENHTWDITTKKLVEYYNESKYYHADV